MTSVDIEDVAPNTLVDISNVKIGGTSPSERLDSLIAQVRNPYVFRVGNTPVRISFRNNGKTMEDALRHYFIGLKR